MSDSPSNTELLLLKEEISLTFGNGSGDGKAYCDLEDIFLWVFAHDQAREQDAYKKGYIDAQTASAKAAGLA